MQRLTSSLILLPRWQAVPDAKRLIFIRHAEGWHNKDYNEIPNYNVSEDPRTPQRVGITCHWAGWVCRHRGGLATGES